jgi:hypothetical protein
VPAEPIAQIESEEKMATGVRRFSVLRWSLMVIAAVGLSIDAYVHFHLASAYSGVRSSVLSQGDLFRAEATVAVIAAAALLIRPRRYTAALAFLVAAGGTAAVVFYTYVNLGALGPLPNMYDPAWYTEKSVSAVAEGVAAVAPLLLLALLHAEWRQSSRATARSDGRPAVRARG